MENDEFVAEFRKTIRAGIIEQMERHFGIDPDADRNRVIDIQIQQAKERIQKLLEDEERPDYAGLYQGLIDWLPTLAKEFKR